MVNHFTRAFALHRNLYVALGLAIIVGFTPWAFLGMLACLVLWALIWPFPKAVDSLLFRLFLAFCLTAATIQLFGFLFWLAGISYTPGVAVIAQSLVLGVALLATPERAAPKLIRRADLAPLALSLITVLLMGAGTFRAPFSTNLLQATTNAFDDTIHTTLAITTYDNQGYVYGGEKEVIGKVIYKALVAYPQGWHLHSSIWWHSFDNAVTKSPLKIMAYYLLSKLVWFGVLIFLACRLVLFLYMFKNDGKASLSASVAAFLSVGLLLIFLLFGVYKYGFASYLPVLVFLISLPFFLVPIADDDQKALSANLLTSMLLSGGLSLSWLLAAPIGYVPSLLALFDRFGYKLNGMWQWVKASRAKVAVILLVAAVGMSQFFIQILYSENADLLNTDGGIWKLSPAIFSIVVLAGAWTISRIGKPAAKTFSYLLVCASLLTAFVFVYQYATAGKATYYSTKTAYLPFLLFYLLVCVSAVELADRMSRRNGIIPTSLLLLAVGVLIPFSSDAPLGQIKEVIGADDKLSNTTAARVVEQIDQKTDYIIVHKDSNNEEDLISTYYLSMLTRKQNACQSFFTWLQIINDDPQLLAKIKECAGQSENAQFAVIASAQNSAVVHAALDDTRNIRIVVSE